MAYLLSRQFYVVMSRTIVYISIDVLYRTAR
jgi:hypothetical protein